MTATMMTPRSYQYSSSAKRMSRSASEKKSIQFRVKEEKVVSHKDTQHERKAQEKKKMDTSGKPKRIASISHSTLSEPMIIPTRTAEPKPRRARDDEMSRRESRDQHDPNALSPSMAALLAVASAPPTSARAIKGDHRQRLMRDRLRKSVSSTSPRSWSVLQSPPSPSETDNEQDKDTDVEFDVGSLTSQSTLADRLAMYRSLSSDSTPSLDIESGIVVSPESPPMPRTPSSRRARSPRREKTKLISAWEPLGEDELHPLSVTQVLGENEPAKDAVTEVINDASPQEELDITRRRKSSVPPQTSSNFKSNLTASLQRLKSAARSISIHTPSVSTVLAINSKFLIDKHPEPRRPKSSLSLTNSAFSDETLATLGRQNGLKHPLAQQLYFSSTPGEEYRPISSSVQLQEYIRRVPDENPMMDRASAPPIFAASSPPPPILLPGIDSPRPREPRENSDFLRVVVLEMNMRRAGKLGDVAGRARIWVGPRPEKVKSKTGEPVASAKEKESGAVPRAEKGMGAEVMTELAEAMMLEAKKSGEDASPINEKLGLKGSILTKQIPSRWIEWRSAEEVM